MMTETLPTIVHSSACTWEQETTCRASVYWDDAVPLCCVCGLYRLAAHRKAKRTPDEASHPSPDDFLD